MFAPQVQTSGPAPRLTPSGASDRAVPAIAAALRAWAANNRGEGDFLCYVLDRNKCAAFHPAAAAEPLLTHTEVAAWPGIRR